MRIRFLAIAAFVLTACEGEPPKTPVVALVPGAEPIAAATTEESAEPDAGQAPSAALPPCACACNCTGAAAAAAAPADGGVAPAVAVQAPPAATAAASVTGVVTSVPKTSAAHAVVYLEDAPIAPGAKMSATISNKMMTFDPFVGVIPVGGKIIFRNEDPFPHNVFSPDNERFNIGMIAQHAAVARVFKTPGAYTLLCNLHPGMIGYVFVSPSSYFAKADAQGRFAIKGVPPGTYKVTAWAPRQQPATQSVTVKDGDASINFDLHR